MDYRKTAGAKVLEYAVRLPKLDESFLLEEMESNPLLRADGNNNIVISLISILKSKLWALLRNFRPGDSDVKTKLLRNEGAVAGLPSTAFQRRLSQLGDIILIGGVDDRDRCMIYLLIRYCLFDYP